MAKTRFIFLLMIIATFILSGYAVAGEPTEQVRSTVNKVLNILNKKELKNPGKEKERRTLIRKAVSERFNFEEMAKRSLATHWAKRTPGERKEFVPLFSDLLERSYIKKIEGYTGEEILYTSESIEEEYAIVKTKIKSKKNIETPVDYKLAKAGNKWEVYDVVIEGVSLVNNYRTQFNKIIVTQSYQALVKKMKNKQEAEAFGEIR